MLPPSIDETDISPPPFPGHVQRDALIKQIAQEKRKLTLVQAAPGYGKTALLSQLFHRDKSPSIWLNIRESDNDPVSLLEKISAALAKIHPDGGKAPLHQFDGFALASLTPWLKSLINEMNAFEHFKVFINDADFLVDSGAIDILNNLLNFSTTSVRFYVATAKPPRFSYSHLLLENQVSLIPTTTLRFSTDEILQAFKQLGRSFITDAWVRQLATLTEGWPTAICFAANTLTSESDLLAFISDLENGPMAFDRYFVEKIYERQPASMQRLLLRLSMLDSFNSELCHTLSDPDENVLQVTALLQNQSFVAPIDARGQWFRFQQMFCVFLRKQSTLALTQADLQQTQLKAAHWFKNAARDEEAIALALQANAPALAARWIEEALPTTVVRRGKHATYLNWIKSLPESVLRAHPRIRLGHIVSLSIGRHYLAVAEQIAMIHQYKQEYSDTVNRELGRTLDLVYCCAKALQDDASVEADISRWLDTWNDISNYDTPNDYHYELGFAWLVKGYCAKCRSAFALAQEALTLSHNHFDAYGSPWGQAWVRSMIAVNYARQGFHCEALKEALDAYQFAQNNLGEKSHPGFGLAALIAAIHYEIDALPVAEHYLQDALDSLKEQSATDLLIAAFETRARLLMHEGAHEEGIGFLKDGIKWAESQRLERLKLRLADEMVVWMIRLRRATDAERYASHFDLLQRSADEFDPTIPAHNTTARSRVYLLLERRNASEAVRLLELLIERSVQLKHQRRCAEWHKLMAMAQERNKSPEKAQAALIKALQIAAQQNYFRLFIDDYAALTRLLTAVEALPIKKGYGSFLNRMLKNVKPEGKQTPPMESLTNKEIEILRFLESGQSNKQMAEQLFVSEGTIKWHLHNIYSKLHAKNRTQALAAARQQGYL